MLAPVLIIMHIPRMCIVLKGILYKRGSMTKYLVIRDWSLERICSVQKCKL